MDLWHKTLKWLDHNRYTALGAALFAACAVYLAACASTTQSLREPGRTVTRAALSLEVVSLRADLATEEAELNKLIAAHNAKIEATNKAIELASLDLDQKDAQRAAVVNAIGGAVIKAVSGGPVDLLGLATTGVGLLGLFVGGGAVVDNRRKDKVIAKKSAP